MQIGDSLCVPCRLTYTGKHLCRRDLKGTCEQCTSFGILDHFGNCRKCGSTRITGRTFAHSFRDILDNEQVLKNQGFTDDMDSSWSRPSPIERALAKVRSWASGDSSQHGENEAVMRTNLLRRTYAVSSKNS
jgi:hypothetical protein